MKTPNTGSILILPPEMLSMILTRLSPFDLSRLLQVSSRFKTVVENYIKTNKFVNISESWLDEQNVRAREEFERGAASQACWTSRAKAAAQSFIGVYLLRLIRNQPKIIQRKI